MTTRQYERFNNICKSIDSVIEKKKDIFKKNNAIITISDTQKENIKITMKTYKGKYNEKYIYDLSITQLKLLEAKNKRLDFDNKCDINIAFELKPELKNKNRRNKNVWKNKKRA